MTNKNNYKGGFLEMDEFKENDVYPDIYGENKNNYKGGISEMNEFKEIKLYPDIYDEYSKYHKIYEKLSSIHEKIKEDMDEDIEILEKNGEYDYIDRINTMYAKLIIFMINVMGEYIKETETANIVNKYRVCGFLLEDIENEFNEMECEK